MRRLAAILLFIPLGILFIGAVNLSSVCPMTPQDGCTASGDHCCHKGKCATKSDSRKDNKTDRSACCFDCPLCALVTAKPFIRFEWVRAVSFLDYAVTPEDNLQDYFQEHWKPPDLAHLS